MTTTPQDHSVLLKQYRASLLDDVIPWWQRHSPDEECGTYFSCLDREGSPTSGHKYTWAIARQAWMFSRVCNTLGPRSDWVELARSGVVFLDENAIRDDGSTYFRFAREGTPLAEHDDIHTRCVIVAALAEFAKASGEEWYADNAIELYESAFAMLGHPTDAPFESYPLDGYAFHSLADDRFRLTTARVLNDVRPQDRWRNNLEESCRSIISRHWHAELDALLENVAFDGTPLLDIPEGRLIHIGHAMESAWMMIEAGSILEEPEFTNAGAAIVKSAMNRGWDEDRGGLRHLTSLDGAMALPSNDDTRLWSVHANALYATLAAWVRTGDRGAADRHARVHEYTLAHFPDAEHGEWFGWLGPDGKPIVTDKANGFKGCFHIPRALERCIQLLERLPVS